MIGHDGVVALRGSRTSLIAAAGSLVLATTLSSCTVPTAGFAAIGVDEDGGLIGLIQMCDHHVDGATLYRSDGPPNDRSRRPILGRWESGDAVTDFARWSLASPSDGWTASTGYEDPHAGAEYAIYGWTHDNSWSAQHAHFTLAQVNTLQPGQVLYKSGLITTEAYFRQHACDVYREPLVFVVDVVVERALGS